MVHVSLATEDELSEAVGKRLLAEVAYPFEVGSLIRKNGNGYLRSKVKNWCELSRTTPVLLLTDLDSNPCPPSLIEDWFGGMARPNQLIFSIAVRSTEAWLLADHEAMRQLIGQRGKLPSYPDTLDIPKNTLLTLAKHAPREIRQSLIKETGAIASQGMGYNRVLTEFVKNTWNPLRASTLSPSLKRAYLRLNELSQRYQRNS